MNTLRAIENNVRALATFSAEDWPLPLTGRRVPEMLAAGLIRPSATPTWGNWFELAPLGATLVAELHLAEPDRYPMMDVANSLRASK